MREHSAAVIGGGVTGLTVAFCLKRKGVPVTVYEASGRVGGVIQSIREGGFLAEFGPNTILETSPRIGQLVRDAGLAGRRLDRTRRQRRATWCAMGGRWRCRIAPGVFSRASFSPPKPSWPCCANRLCRRAATARRRAWRNSSSAAWAGSFSTMRLTRWWPGFMRAILASCRCRRPFRNWPSSRPATAR